MSDTKNGAGPVSDSQAAQKKDNSRFGITQKEIIQLIQKYKTREFDEDIKSVQDHGGMEGLIEKLKSNKETGITPNDFAERNEMFGSNHRDPMEADTCCEMFKGALDDFMLKLLMVCAIVSITVDMLMVDGKKHPDEYYHAWVDGFAIMVAVLVVSGVGSIVDYKKGVEFVSKRNLSDSLRKITVIREGKKIELHPNGLYVGDIIKVNYGVSIPVDGILIEGNIGCDESAMTGESDELMKEIPSECDKLHAASETDDTKHMTRKVGSAMKNELPSSILQSGTSVASGDGTFMCLMVGPASCLGMIEAKTGVKEEEKTPLQLKLEEIAEDIGKLGTIFAILTVHVLLLRFIWEGLMSRNIDLFGGEEHAEEEGCSKNGCFLKYVGDIFKALIIGIVIIVVAVPEGLPLAVMISLAFSIGQMLKDKCEVKKLASCEIMGGANNICSDKTGTLTNNVMEVVQLYSDKNFEMPTTVMTEKDDKGEVKINHLGKLTKIVVKCDLAKFGFNANFKEKLIEGICCNVPEDKLSPTDEAMTYLMQAGEGESVIQDQAEAHKTKEKIRFPFTSARKRMSTITTNHGQGGYDHRCQLKGASEIVLDVCTHYLDVNGDVQPINDTYKETIKNDVIKKYASKAYRTIALAYKDIQENEAGAKHDEEGAKPPIKKIEEGGFTLIAILGIEDTIRAEVPGAVEQIQAAGVTVRMVTGDNIDTAKAIAVQCNILKQADYNNPDCYMTGIDFYEKCGGLKEVKDIKTGKKKEYVMNSKVFEKLQAKLVVIARCRPEDKYLMVTGLRNLGCTVAVTGDGTNDAPALKKADVGFGMSLAGTDTCKEAADILIMDDNFTAIVKAAMWGRNVYDNIQRFLQFQLSVNFVALTVTFVGACIMKESPLNAIQLLWVNLIMDSLAALALATSAPKPDLLKRNPQERGDYLVSRRMIKHIMYQSIYQSIILCIIAFFGEYIIYEPHLARRYDRPDVPYIYPGRAFDWTWVGEAPLFKQWRKENTVPFTVAGNPVNDKVGCDAGNADWVWDDVNDSANKNGACYFPGGSSRHFTFFFTTFVILQQFNMLCARKIHDEKNIFSGMCDNWVFIAVWLGIVGLQILITQAGGIVFEVCSTGLAWEQWLISFGIGSTVLIVNFLIKFIPDRFTPSNFGKDTVFNNREEACGRPINPNF